MSPYPLQFLPVPLRKLSGAVQALHRGQLTLALDLLKEMEKKANEREDKKSLGALVQIEKQLRAAALKANRAA